MTSGAPAAWLPGETRTAAVALSIAGLVIAFTAVSFALHTTFPVPGLVTLATAGFAALAALSLESPRGWRSRGGKQAATMDVRSGPQIGGWECLKTQRFESKEVSK